MTSEKYIHFIAQYAAPYKGNFIPSLEILEQSLCAYSVIYTFPRKAETQPWMDEFKHTHTVRYTDDDVRSFQSVQQLEEIFSEFPPSLVHTHFDGYDVSVVKAAKEFDCNIVWHMHNWLMFVPNIAKKIYQYWCFFKHYSLANKKNVYIISVCEEMRKFACKFAFTSKRSITIPNGIDISRFELPAPRPKNRNPFIFLAFGGRNSQKRIDLICEAVKRLDSKLYPFEVRITKGIDTEDIINKGKYNNIKTIRLVEQSNNIAQYFSTSHCFISSSVHEGCSYANIEAAICGCAIIQSDIPGNAWNNKGAATWVFPSEDVQALADKMQQVMTEDEQKLTDRCQAASTFILKNYSLSAWKDKILQFYKDNQLI